MRRRGFVKWLTACAAAALLAVAPAISASAYTPVPNVLYQLPGSEDCLKGRGNCVIYAKSAELASGRLVAAFEEATVTDYPAPDTIGGAIGGTMPVWKSDDHGTSWQHLSDVASPAAMTDDPALDKYSSNWGSPYLYVLPQTVGSLPAGTLLLASVVTGEDEYYREQKLRDPNWVPTNDGDRRDMAVALYRSDDDGRTWSFVNIVAAGGWQGGSAGAIGVNIAQANSTRQQDPVWEPHLTVIGGRLVAYYSDENDYIGYDSTTGVPTIAPYNETGPDSRAQILVHKTWDGTAVGWSQPVVDVAGDTFAFNGGQQIGGGRPGMTTVAPTSDGRWFMTFEYFGGSDNVRYKLSNDPLKFYADGDPNGTDISQLPVDAGSRRLSTGGSPVVVGLPDGRIAFNAAGSGSIWVNDGASTDIWTEYQTTLGGGYTRTLQPLSASGTVMILQATWGGPSSQPSIAYGEVDLGFSAGTYYRIVNRKTGQALGTGSSTNDANLGNGDQPDVRLEAAWSAANPATQLWHVTPKPNDTVTLLNKSGGRAAGIWTGTPSAGQRLGQWVDDEIGGLWHVADAGNGYVRFQSTADAALYMTGAAAGGPVTTQAQANDGSQDWQLVPESAGSQSLRNAGSGLCADVWDRKVSNQSPIKQYACGAGLNQKWQVRSVGASVELVSASSDKCLEIGAYSAIAGAAATQFTCNGGGNQLWTRVTAADGSFTLRNGSSGQCLEVFGGSMSNGAAIGQWPCNGGANQRWTLG
ncbi:RICIN domain-containing protein [Microbacterium natoriense]